MEEYHDFRCCCELQCELTEDDRRGFTGFVEEDTKSFDRRHVSRPESWRETEISIALADTDEVTGGKSIFSFCEPLRFFAVPPNEEDTGKDSRKSDGEPGSLRHFGES